MRYSSLVYEDPDDLVFGRSKYPLRYGFGVEIGRGEVIPEVKYILKPGAEKKPGLLIEGYKGVAKAILHRAVELGVSAVQLETELTEPMVVNKELGARVIEEQKAILEEYYGKYGVNCALRATIADNRRFKAGVWSGPYWDAVMESFESSCEAGADLLSIESRGGQEVFAYSIIRGDVEGILFSLSILACRDMEVLWRNIIEIVGKRSIPAGDTACAFANTAMMLAGGLAFRRIHHVMAAVVRAASAVRSLIAYEEGALGPGKDCAYENVILKAITGKPMSMEGKTAAFAHSSLLGNIPAAVCDLWSNETIEHGDTFSGKMVAAIFEILSYDVRLLNEAVKQGMEKQLRNLLVSSNSNLDPQAIILTPENAVRIGKAILSGGESYYDRTVMAIKEAINIIKESTEALKLPKLEISMLEKIDRMISMLPEEHEFVEKCISKFAGKIPEFNPRNYDL